VGPDLLLPALFQGIPGNFKTILKPNLQCLGRGADFVALTSVKPALNTLWCFKHWLKLKVSVRRRVEPSVSRLARLTLSLPQLPIFRTPLLAKITTSSSSAIASKRVPVHIQQRGQRPYSPSVSTSTRAWYAILVNTTRQANAVERSSSSANAMPTDDTPPSLSSANCQDARSCRVLLRLAACASLSTR
jgi:hypothetical protein